MRKKTTIDDLAVMVKGGFDEVHTRLDQMATKDDLHTLEQKVDAGFQHVNVRLDRIRDDISDLPTIRAELHDLGRRVHRLEQKARLTK